MDHLSRAWIQLAEMEFAEEGTAKAKLAERIESID